MEQQLVGVKDLAKKYGPPATWWYSAAERGQIPSYKIGKYVRFKPAEIEAWLETRRSRSPSER